MQAATNIIIDVRVVYASKLLEMALCKPQALLSMGSGAHMQTNGTCTHIDSEFFLTLTAWIRDIINSTSKLEQILSNVGEAGGRCCCKDQIQCVCSNLDAGLRDVRCHKESNARSAQPLCHQCLAEQGSTKIPPPKPKPRSFAIKVPPRSRLSMTWYSGSSQKTGPVAQAYAMCHGQARYRRERKEAELL